MNNKQAEFLLTVALVFVGGFVVGYEYSTYLRLSDKIRADKLQLCVDSYKQDHVRTLADPFCDEFFKVLRSISNE